MNYFETVKPTYIENWPRAMHSISFSSVPTKLSIKEARVLGASIMEWGEGFGSRDVVAMQEIRSRLDKAMKFMLPGGAFVRLGSRSPKDAWSGITKGFKCLTVDRAIELLTDCSERMSDDLHLAIHEKYEPTIWLRSWVENLGFEIRCFVKNRKLVGATQGSKAVGLQSGRTWIDAIVRYINQDFLPLSHLDDVVVDLAVRSFDEGSGTHPVTMIEINPYFEHTDPILFDWKKPDEIEAGWFRYKNLDSTVVTETLAPPKLFETNVEL